ncbi:MAG: hypothetical protein Q9227_002165 [Pyrenula ochraceoflavens]
MAHKAAWLETKCANPLVVRDAPAWKPGKGEVLVANKAIAVNPVDWKIQDEGARSYHAISLLTTEPAHASFQSHTLIPRSTVSLIPASLPFTQATVLPLSLSTAASALYQHDTLALPLPTLPPNPAGKSSGILIWGGSSSVGLAGIQLARASGLTVFTTASPHNHALCKSVGASHVFDHAASDIVAQITTAVKSSGTKLAGVYDAISLEPTLKASAQITASLGGGTVAAVLSAPERFKAPEGVTVTPMVFAALISVEKYKTVADGVWRDWVPQALEEGVLKCVPEPIVAAKGVEGLQKGTDRCREGVSAKKIVVEF